jgi:hypothetical protein
MAGLSPFCKARRMKTRSPVQGGHQRSRRNAEEHAVHLRQLFTRLREQGLVINVDKCVFGAPSIQFLGHRLSAEGVEPLPENVSAVMDFPRPSTVKDANVPRDNELLPPFSAWGRG